MVRGGIVLCVPVSPVEATGRGRLSHGKVWVCLVLLAQDALHRAVVRRLSVCVVFVWWSDRWLFVMVHVVRGGWGHLKHPDLYLQGTMSSNLGWQVVVSCSHYLDVCRVCVAEVDAGIC